MPTPTSPRVLPSGRRSRLQINTSSFEEQNASSSRLNDWTTTGDQREQTKSEHDGNHSGGRWKDKVARSWQRRFWWPTELLHFVISAALLVGTVILLIEYDGSSLSVWPLSITPNALVSVMITLAAIFIITPLNSCIAQQRWNRFHKRRRLSEYHRISQARTPMGAVRLILTLQGGPIALFGAAMVLLNFFVGPFVQQLIHLELIAQSSPRVPRMPIVKRYHGPDTTDTNIENAVGFPMRNAVFQGFYSASANFQVMPSCPSGPFSTGSYCEWSDYMTLQFCSSCIDLSSNVTTTTNTSDASSDRNTSWTMPGGVILEEGGANATQFIATTRIPKAEEFPYDPTSPTSVLALALMGRTRISEPHIKAAACQIAYCTQAYSATFSNGGLVEIPHGPPGLNFDDGGNQFGRFGNFGVYGNATYTINNMLGRLMEMEMQAGTYPDISLVDDDTNDSTFGSSTSVPEHGRILRNALLNPNASSRYGNLTILMSNIGESLSMALRMSTNAKEQVLGMVIEKKLILRVEWPWIALPAAFYVLTFVLLALSIAETRIKNVGLRKDNDLASLFHGLDPDARAGKGSLVHADEMKLVAKGVMVKLTHSDIGWYLTEDHQDAPLENYRGPHFESHIVEPEYYAQDLEHETDAQEQHEDHREETTIRSMPVPSLNTQVAPSTADFDPRDRYSPVSPE